MDCDHDPSDFYIHGCGSATKAQSGVHALIVGTSEYQYPHTGSSDYEQFLDIPGAALGAAKFAAFLADGYHDPLGREVLTVRLLLSHTPDERPELDRLGVTHLPATKDAVTKALQGWFRDCDQSPDNVAIIYVAGHGLYRVGTYSHAFIKATGDDPDAFAHSLNLEIIQAALEYNYSQTIVLITDCCADYYFMPNYENGIFINPQYMRGDVGHRYDALHIAAARKSASTYALGATKGTILSDVLEQLLIYAGELVRHPALQNQEYFAITQPAMSEQVDRIFEGHPQARLPHSSCPRIRGQTVAGGLHRPQPPPEFDIEFVMKDQAAAGPVAFTLTPLAGGESRTEKLFPGQTITMRLPAARYLRRAGAADMEIEVDRAKRFDILSRDVERL